MKRSKFVSDQQFASTVLKLRASGISDKAMVANLVRALPMKTRTVQGRLKKLRENGPPKDTVIPWQTPLKSNGVSSARIPSASPNNANGPQVDPVDEVLKKVEAFGGPVMKDRASQIITTLQSSTEAAVRFLTTNLELLGLLRDDLVKEAVPPTPANSPLDKQARLMLHGTLQAYGAWVHPKLGADKWPPATGECIRDLTHRAKAHMGTPWDCLSAQQVVEVAGWLYKQTNSHFDGFLSLAKDVQAYITLNAAQTMVSKPTEF